MNIKTRAKYSPIRTLPMAFVLFLLCPMELAVANKLEPIKTGSLPVKIAAAASAAASLAANVDRAIEIKNNLARAQKITKLEDRSLSKQLQRADHAVTELNEFSLKISKRNGAETLSDQKKFNERLGAAARAISDFGAFEVSQLVGEAKEEFTSVLKEINEDLRAVARASGCNPLNNNCMKCKPDPPGEIICVP